MFIANRVGRAASSGDKVQIPAGVAFFLCDVLKMDGSLAGNVDVEARKGESWWKSGTKSSFWCSHLSRLGSFSCGLAVSAGEAAKLFLFFVTLTTVKIAGPVLAQWLWRRPSSDRSWARYPGATLSWASGQLIPLQSGNGEPGSE